jgi:CBS domain containing-hemolysin-like protein
MLAWYLLLIFLLVGLNAFFVSVEFAVVAARRARLELLADEDDGPAALVKSWLENPAWRDRLISASQLGISLASLALGAVGLKAFEITLAPYFENLALSQNWAALRSVLAVLPLALFFLLIAGLHFILGEQAPKVAVLRQPERVAVSTARPMRIFGFVFKWLIDILDWGTRRVLALAGLQVVPGYSSLFTVDELKQIVSESQEGGLIEQPEREMLDAIFNFGELLVRQVMIPRTEIVAVEADAPLLEILALVNQSTYTKFPVYDDNLDQIKGIVHIKDLLVAIQKDGWQGQTARSLLREPVYVPENIPVSGLLHLFRANRQHIAIVLDEFGGTAGLVTLEDLLEEIVGEVSDPFDRVTPDIQPQPDGSFLIDGLTLIEEVNAELGLVLEDPHYDTIAGYMLGRLGRIPKEKEVVESDGLRLQVEAMDGLRISRLSLTRLDPQLNNNP